MESETDTVITDNDRDYFSIGEFLSNWDGKSGTDSFLVLHRRVFGLERILESDFSISEFGSIG